MCKGCGELGPFINQVIPEVEMEGAQGGGGGEKEGGYSMVPSGWVQAYMGLIKGHG